MIEEKPRISQVRDGRGVARRHSYRIIVRVDYCTFQRNIEHVASVALHGDAIQKHYSFDGIGDVQCLSSYDGKVDKLCGRAKACA